MLSCARLRKLKDISYYIPIYTSCCVARTLGYIQMKNEEKDAVLFISRTLCQMNVIQYMMNICLISSSSWYYYMGLAMDALSVAFSKVWFIKNAYSRTDFVIEIMSLGGICIFLPRCEFLHSFKCSEFLFSFFIFIFTNCTGLIMGILRKHSDVLVIPTRIFILCTFNGN